MSALLKIEPEKTYTYEEYCTWQTGLDRYELLDGVPYMMAAPNRAHQEVSMNLSGEIYALLKGRNCKVYASPFDLRLQKKEDSKKKNDTVVQPDIFIVCQHNKKITPTKAGMDGAPDLVIEIISPSNSRHDRLRKFNQYAEAGVKEYWLVHPTDHTIEVYLLQDNDHYQINEVYTRKDTITATVVEELAIELSLVFEPEDVEYL